MRVVWVRIVVVEESTRTEAKLHRANIVYRATRGEAALRDMFLIAPRTRSCI